MTSGYVTLLQAVVVYNQFRLKALKIITCGSAGVIDFSRATFPCHQSISLSGLSMEDTGDVGLQANAPHRCPAERAGRKRASALRRLMLQWITVVSASTLVSLACLCANMVVCLELEESSGVFTFVAVEAYVHCCPPP